jgi:hypothetical protein
MRLAGRHESGFDASVLEGVLTHPQVAAVLTESHRAKCLEIAHRPGLADLVRTIRFFDCLEDESRIVVDVIRVAVQKKTCPTCHVEFASGQGKLTCLECGEVVLDATPVTLFSGNMNGLGGTSIGCASNRSNDGGGGAGDYDAGSCVSSSENSNTDEHNTFRKAWDAMHGTHKPRLPVDFFDQLDVYFTRQGRPTGAQVRAQPVIINLYGEQAKEGTSVEALHRALKSLQLAFYADEFYIRYVYWGWPLPDASSVRERVFRNYERTRKVYPLIPGARETSKLNAWYWLYQELRGAGFEISPHLFNLVGTEKIREWHDRIREQMCILASQDGDEPIPFFPTM